MMCMWVRGIMFTSVCRIISLNFGICSDNGVFLSFILCTALPLDDIYFSSSFQERHVHNYNNRHIQLWLEHLILLEIASCLFVIRGTECKGLHNWHVWIKEDLPCGQIWHHFVYGTSNAVSVSCYNVSSRKITGWYANISTV